jgi:6,7-dimethyl-8-ribityllumazine synthase
MIKLKGEVRGAGLRVAIVASRFNEEITGGLVSGALQALREAGVAENEVTLIAVPGAFEIPLAVQQAARSKKYNAVIAIGCVIRGETSHFEYISHAATTGISRVALDSGVPVTLGILTTDTDEQAIARSQADSNNKGFEAAMAAVEMVNLLKQI